MKVKVRYVEVIEGVREIEGTLEEIIKEVESAQEKAGHLEIKRFETESMYAELTDDEGNVVKLIHFC